MRRLLLKIFLLFMCITFNSFLLAEDNLRTIKVSGNSNIWVTPDNVTIHFQIDVLNKNLKSAKELSNKIFNDVMKVSDQFRLDQTKVKTNYLSIYPKYGYQDVFLGYQVTKAMAFTLDDLSKFEELLSCLLTSGIERINNITYSVVDSRKYRDQARSDALKAAKEKAEAMANEYGKKIGEPISIMEESDSNSYWHAPSLFNSTANIPGSTITSEGIAYGKNSINSKVTVIFELK